MITSKILGVGDKFPRKVLTNEDLEKIVDTSDEWITQRTGIKKRRITENGETASDLAVVAARDAIEDANLTPKDIDMIVVATVTPDMPFPSTGCVLQDRLGIEDIPAFDLSAGCTGFIYALTVADSFIKSGSVNNILVIGVELLSKITDWEDRGTCVLFGDAAGAVVLGRSDDDNTGILSTYISADGRLGDLLKMPGGGSKMPASHESIDKKLHYLKMEGNDVFKSAVRAMERSALKGLKAANMSADELDWLVPHQANIRIIDFLARRLDMPSEKVVVTIDEYGNTSSASIPTSFCEAIKDGRIKRGDSVLMVAFGAGFTWGSVLLRY